MSMTTRVGIGGDGAKISELWPLDWFQACDWLDTIKWIRSLA